MVWRNEVPLELKLMTSFLGQAQQGSSCLSACLHARPNGLFGRRSSTSQGLLEALLCNKSKTCAGAGNVVMVVAAPEGLLVLLRDMHHSDRACGSFSITFKVKANEDPSFDEKYFLGTGSCEENVVHGPIVRAPHYPMDRHQPCSSFSIAAGSYRSELAVKEVFYSHARLLLMHWGWGSI